MFPSLAKANPPSIGNSRFISEAELEKVKKERGGRVEDGAVGVDRPLAVVLQENKDKKARRRLPPPSSLARLLFPPCTCGWLAAPLPDQQSRPINTAIYRPSRRALAIRRRSSRRCGRR